MLLRSLSTVVNAYSIVYRYSATFSNNIIVISYLNIYILDLSRSFYIHVIGRNSSSLFKLSSASTLSTSMHYLIFKSVSISFLVSSYIIHSSMFIKRQIIASIFFTYLDIYELPILDKRSWENLLNIDKLFIIVCIPSL